ncbi:MAG: MBL fold metallo-hydrolase [Actinomycetota bacterium]
MLARLPAVRSTFEAAEGIRAIDSLMCGRERVTSCYLIEAAEPALVETGPSTSLDAVLDGLGELGVGADDLAHIVVTHIHLDHAGGAGTLAPHFPGATVWVHERGAPHLADPAKLVASATRVYGEAKLKELFGTVDPVPGDRLRAVTGGDRIGLGDRELEAIYTPGHASHHVALRDSSTGVVFVGDALGVFLPDVRVLRPATPPPEFDLDQAIQSIELIASREPPAVLFSHFGPSPDVTELCALAVNRLRRWTAVVEEALGRSGELSDVVSRLRSGTEDELPPPESEGREQVEDRYELLSSYEMNAMGLIRYIQRGSGQDRADRRSATS